MPPLRIRWLSGTVACLALFFSPPAQAQQSYASIFGQQSTEWVIGFDFINGGGFQDTLYVEKDTTVNGLSYKKLELSVNTDFPGILLREDTVQGLVWAKTLLDPATSTQIVDTTEHIVFDYDLSVGDSFSIQHQGLFSNSYPSQWDIVDSIYSLNGQKYIRFGGGGYLTDIHVTMVEGVSGNLSPIWKTQYEFVGYQMYLLCSYKDGAETNYSNIAHNGNCAVFGQSFVGNPSSTPIRLAPNPFTNEIHIQSGDLAVENVRIFTLLGKIVYEQRTQSNVLRLDDLPKGSYVLQLFSAKGTYSKIIVKN